MTIGVTGATGRIGGRVLQSAAGSGWHGLPALSRRTAPYAHLAAPRAARRGVETPAFASSDGAADRVPAPHHNPLAAAVRRVRRVVVVAGLDVDLESPPCHAFADGYAGQSPLAGRLPYPTVRASPFTGFLLGLMRQARSPRGPLA